VKVELDLKDKLEFVAVGESGHEVVLDASKESGGNDNGPRPMELILHGLAGCTGIDIALILKKMKSEIDNFKIEVNADRAKEHPKRYTNIYLKFIIKGKNLSKKKVEKAIDLSQNKYCSASSSLNANIRSSYEFENVE